MNSGVSPHDHFLHSSFYKNFLLAAYLRSHLEFNICMKQIRTEISSNLRGRYKSRTGSTRIDLDQLRSNKINKNKIKLDSDQLG